MAQKAKSPGRATLLWPLLLLLGGVWFCCSIIACFKVINEKEYHYPLLGRF